MKNQRLLIILALLLALLLFLSQSPWFSGGRRLTSSPSSQSALNGGRQKEFLPVQPLKAGDTEGGSLDHRAASLPGAKSVGQKREPSSSSANALDLVAMDRDTGQVISNVSVEMTDRPTKSNGRAWFFPSGRGTITVSAGQWQIKVSQPDYKTEVLSLDLDQDRAQNIRRTVLLTAHYSVTGSVVDQSGCGVSGAIIQFRGRDGSHVGGAFSLSDGRFECRLPAGIYEASVRKGRDHNETRVTCPLRGPLVIVIHISPGQVSFSGVVRDQKGEGIRQAEIKVWELTQGDRAMPLRLAHTGTDGRFFMELVACLRCTVAISAPGYEPCHEEISLAGSLSKEFELRSFQSFGARLLTSNGSIYDRGFTVRGIGPSASKVVGLGEGRFYTTECPVEIYADASPLGLGMSEVACLACSQQEVLLTICFGGTLAVEVANEAGKPVNSYTMVLKRGDGAWVTYRIRDSPTGSYTAQDIMPGSYTLSVQTEGLNRTENQILVRQGEVTIAKVVVQR